MDATKENVQAIWVLESHNLLSF